MYKKSIFLRVVIVLIVLIAFFVWYARTSDENIGVSSIDDVGVIPEKQTEAGAVDVQPEMEQPVEAADADREDRKAVIDVPDKVSHKVPFVAQAPEAQWEDKRFQDACEEASVLMVHLWASGEGSLSKKEASKTLENLFKAEEPLFGDAIDTSAADTARFIDAQFGYDTTVIENVLLDDIYEALATDALVIVPTDGQALGNPYFSGDGPERHMLVITGYDKKKKEFIVNDPGTKRGAKYRYDIATLYGAIRDYETGTKEPIGPNRKVMIAVRK